MTGSEPDVRSVLVTQRHNAARVMAGSRLAGSDPMPRSDTVRAAPKHQRPRSGRVYALAFGSVLACHDAERQDGARNHESVPSASPAAAHGGESAGVDQGTGWVWARRYSERGGRFYAELHLDDGATLFVAGLGYNDEVDAPQAVRRGVLAAELGHTLARLAEARSGAPANADANEPSGGERLDVGLRGQVVRQLPVNELPTRVQDTLASLETAAADLPVDRTVMALLSAQALEPERAERITNDRRALYKIVPLSAAELARAPSLAAAMRDLGRISAVRAEPEAELIHGLHAASNGARPSRTFFTRTDGGDSHQLFWLPAAELPPP